MAGWPEWLGGRVIAHHPSPSHSPHPLAPSPLSTSRYYSYSCDSSPPPHPLTSPCRFDRVEQEVAALRALSLADLAAFYQVCGGEGLLRAGVVCGAVCGAVRGLVW